MFWYPPYSIIYQLFRTTRPNYLAILRQYDQFELLYIYPHFIFILTYSITLYSYLVPKALSYPLYIDPFKRVVLIIRYTRIIRYYMNRLYNDFFSNVADHAVILETSIDFGTALCANFNSTGSILFIGLFNGEIVLYDILAKFVIDILPTIGSPIISLSSTLCQQYLLATTSAGIITRYDLTSRCIDIQLSLPEPIIWSCISPNNPDICIIVPFSGSTTLINMALESILMIPPLPPFQQSQCPVITELYNSTIYSRLPLSRIMHLYHEPECSNVLNTPSGLVKQCVKVKPTRKLGNFSGDRSKIDSISFGTFSPDGSELVFGSSSGRVFKSKIRYTTLDHDVYKILPLLYNNQDEPILLLDHIQTAMLDGSLLASATQYLESHNSNNNNNNNGPNIINPRQLPRHQQYVEQYEALHPHTQQRRQQHVIQQQRQQQQQQQLMDQNGDDDVNNMNEQQQQTTSRIRKKGRFVAPQLPPSPTTTAVPQPDRSQQRQPQQQRQQLHFLDEIRDPSLRYMAHPFPWTRISYPRIEEAKKLQQQKQKQKQKQQDAMLDGEASVAATAVATAIASSTEPPQALHNVYDIMGGYSTNIDPVPSYGIPSRRNIKDAIKIPSLTLQDNTPSQSSSSSSSESSSSQAPTFDQVRLKSYEYAQSMTNISFSTNNDDYNNTLLNSLHVIDTLTSINKDKDNNNNDNNKKKKKKSDDQNKQQQQQRDNQMKDENGAHTNKYYINNSDSDSDDDYGAIILQSIQETIQQNVSHNVSLYMDQLHCNNDSSIVNNSNNISNTLQSTLDDINTKVFYTNEQKASNNNPFKVYEEQQYELSRDTTTTNNNNNTANNRHEDDGDEGRIRYNHTRPLPSKYDLLPELSSLICGHRDKHDNNNNNIVRYHTTSSTSDIKVENDNISIKNENIIQHKIADNDDDTITINDDTNNDVNNSTNSTHNSDIDNDDDNLSSTMQFTLEETEPIKKLVNNTVSSLSLSAHLYSFNSISAKKNKRKVHNTNNSKVNNSKVSNTRMSKKISSTVKNSCTSTCTKDTTTAMSDTNTNGTTTTTTTTTTSTPAIDDQQQEQSINNDEPVSEPSVVDGPPRRKTRSATKNIKSNQLLTSLEPISKKRTQLQSAQQPAVPTSPPLPPSLNNQPTPKRVGRPSKVPKQFRRFNRDYNDKIEQNDDNNNNNTKQHSTTTTTKATARTIKTTKATTATAPPPPPPPAGAATSSSTSAPTPSTAPSIIGNHINNVTVVENKTLSQYIDSIQSYIYNNNLIPDHHHRANKSYIIPPSSQHLDIPEFISSNGVVLYDVVEINVVHKYQEPIQIQYSNNKSICVCYDNDMVYTISPANTPLVTYKDRGIDCKIKKACFSPLNGHLYILLNTEGHTIKIHSLTRDSVPVLVLEGPCERSYDLTAHPTLPIIASVAASGRVLLWTNHNQESWTAYSPSFQELEQNLEFEERENTFDIEALPSHQGDIRRGYTIDYNIDNIDLITQRSPHVAPGLQYKTIRFNMDNIMKIPSSSSPTTASSDQPEQQETEMPIFSWHSVSYPRLIAQRPRIPIKPRPDPVLVCLAGSRIRQEILGTLQVIASTLDGYNFISILVKNYLIYLQQGGHIVTFPFYMPDGFPIPPIAKHSAMQYCLQYVSTTTLSEHNTIITYNNSNINPNHTQYQALIDQLNIDIDGDPLFHYTRQIIQYDESMFYSGHIIQKSNISSGMAASVMREVGSNPMNENDKHTPLGRGAGHDKLDYVSLLSHPLLKPNKYNDFHIIQQYNNINYHSSNINNNGQ